ncbi:polysaccharide biosynthesis/export family protein, partial [Hyphomonas sp.]|uniref:polysaccharide biosynthesis/export family protein n=1 Tax=Hyphomonas sp. TaxID=87 RepID=UPI0037C06215
MSPCRFFPPALLSLGLAPLPVLATVSVHAQPSATLAGASSLEVRQTPTSTELSPELLQDDAYILGPGDGLSVRFLIETELSSTLQILNDGTASLPLLG